jgi:hypothetical protein
MPIRHYLTGAILLAGCSQSAPRANAPQFTARDSAGIEVVDNLSSAGATWQVDSVPTTAIGSDEGDPHAQFTRIVAAHRLSDRRVAVATDKGVLLFGADGKFVRAVAGAGEGPGEFRDVEGLTRLRGDTLVVADFLGRKVAHFTPDGTLLREEHLDGARFNRLASWGECKTEYLPDGSRLACAVDAAIPKTETNRDPPGRDPGPGLLRQLKRMYIVSPTLDTAYKLGVEAGIEQFGVKGPQQTMFFMHPFYSWSLVAAGGAPMRVVSMTNPAYVIEVWTPQGKLERIIRRPNGRRAPTPAERTGALATLHKEASRYRDTTGIDAILAAVPMPDSLPAAVALMVSDSGLIFVMREGMLSGQTSTRLDVFDRQGHWLGVLALPPRIRLLEAGADYLLYARFDQDDVPHIEVHRMTRLDRRG